MSTFMAKAEDVERKWYVIDADGMTLGRLASETAKTGDYVIIVNAAKVKVTGKKLEQKVYFRHSDYVGGAKYTTLKEMLQKKPEKVVEHAVRGMIPHGVLGDSQYRKLHVYAGPDHEQAAQKPEELKL